MNVQEEDIDSFEKCRNYTVSIIECGNIGIPHACLFADAGFKVVGVNANPHILKSLKKGQSPFFKERTYRTLEKYMKEGVFTASSDARKAASESDIIVIATQIAVDGKKKPDYSLLEKTCKEVGIGLKKGSLVLFVSATGPGTVEGSMCEIFEKTSGLKAGLDFSLASSPIKANSQKRLSKLSNSLRVVGAIDEPSLRTASLVLNRISKSEILKVSSIKTAEAVNLFQNVYSETNLALANELAFLCEKLKIDFLEILKVANKDAAFYLPLPGITDGAVRRDFYLLLEEAENVNLNPRLMLLAGKINDEVVDYAFRLVKDALKVCGKTVRRAKVSVLGISRRPNVKERPRALIKNIINLLKKKVRTVQVYDPFFSQKELTELGFKGEKLSKAVEGTDCIIVLAGHSKFERLNLKKIKFLAKKSPAIVDLGHVIDPVKAEEYGFVYRGLGRGVWTK
ncbi:MAG: nucleotide sugar dehydrogenase [Candidatus Bathyarchaeota archaeon]|nr:nucleotide sugar dehydrogenase [Candidatus Bathyarchaeota archaeon]